MPEMVKWKGRVLGVIIWQTVWCVKKNCLMCTNVKMNDGSMSRRSNNKKQLLETELWI